MRIAAMSRWSIALALALGGMSSHAAADLNARYRLNVPAQSVFDALKEFAAQTKLQVVYYSEVGQGVSSPGAVGFLEANDALEQLLGGTGLTYQFLNDHTIAIRRTSADAAPAAAPRKNEGTSPRVESDSPVPSTSRGGMWSRLRLAQADEVEPRDTSSRSSSDAPVPLDEVMITGSRLSRGPAPEGAVPVRAYNREVMERSGQTTVADFLNTLPEVSVGTPENGGVFSGQTTVQLRGLPQGTTLTLLNGRRLENGGGTAFYGGYFDLNNIPAVALERIEIVPQGSSAVYGSDALAGVVNFILKKDFEGLQATAHYGAASGVNEKAIDFAWGHHNERASFSLIGTYYTRTELEGREREVASSDAFGLLTDRCSPGNVYSTDGSALAGLSSSSASIATGVQGVPTLGDFNAGATRNCRQYGHDNLIPPTDRMSLLASGSLHITDDIEAFTEIMYSHSTQETVLNYRSLNKVLVPASNAFNPFGEAVQVSYSLATPYTQYRYESAVDFSRPLVGVRGKFFSDWSWEVTAWDSRDEDRYVQAANLLNSAALASALASSDPATALNVFSDQAPGSPELLQTIYSPEHLRAVGDARVASAIAHGSLFDLPTGPVDLAIGAEYTQNKLNWRSPTDVSSTFAYDRQVRSAFAEARVPIVANRSNPRAGERLAVSAAVRYDDYSDFGSNVTPQYAVEFRPIDALLVRASYAEAFRAPGLVQLYAPSRTYDGLCCVNDTLNGGASVTYTGVYGGNSALKPETGSSKSFGLVWSPEAVAGLQTSLTYWEIGQQNRASQGISPQTFVDHPELFPGRVTRDAVTNQITSIDGTYLNFGDLDVSGIDFDVTYQLDTQVGRFSPAISIANMQKYDAAVTPGAPETDRLSKADIDAWAPRWKGTASLAWSHGSYSATALGRYVSEYLDYQTPDPTDARLGNFWLFDLSAKYRFASDRISYLSGGFVQLSVVNLFDSLPKPSWFNYGSQGYDSTQYDIRGRFISLTIGVDL